MHAPEQPRCHPFSLLRFCCCCCCCRLSCCHSPLLISLLLLLLLPFVGDGRKEGGPDAAVAWSDEEGVAVLIINMSCRYVGGLIQMRASVCMSVSLCMSGCARPINCWRMPVVPLPRSSRRSEGGCRRQGRRRRRTGCGDGTCVVVVCRWVMDFRPGRGEGGGRRPNHNQARVDLCVWREGRAWHRNATASKCSAVSPESACVVRSIDQGRVQYVPAGLPACPFSFPLRKESSSPRHPMRTTRPYLHVNAHSVDEDQLVIVHAALEPKGTVQVPAMDVLGSSPSMGAFRSVWAVDIATTLFGVLAS